MCFAGSPQVPGSITPIKPPIHSCVSSPDEQHAMQRCMQDIAPSSCAIYKEHVPQGVEGLGCIASSSLMVHLLSGEWRCIECRVSCRLMDERCPSPQGG